MAWLRCPSHRVALLALAAAAIAFAAACRGGGEQAQPPPPSPFPSPSGLSFEPPPEPPGERATPPPAGLTIEDNCVSANIPGRQGVGQIRGGGLDLQVEASSPQAFSRAVADTATVICAPGVTQAEVDGLIARLNSIEGLVVRGHSWTPG